LATKIYFFITLKKVVHILNEDILFVPAASGFGTKDQIVTNNGEKYVADNDKDQSDLVAAHIDA
jgi:hypothetical protein